MSEQENRGPISSLLEGLRGGDRVGIERRMGPNGDVTSAGHLNSISLPDGCDQDWLIAHIRQVYGPGTYRLRPFTTDPRTGASRFARGSAQVQIAPEPLQHYYAAPQQQQPHHPSYWPQPVYVPQPAPAQDTAGLVAALGSVVQAMASSGSTSQADAMKLVTPVLEQALAARQTVTTAADPMAMLTGLVKLQRELRNDEPAEKAAGDGMFKMPESPMEMFYQLMMMQFMGPMMRGMGMGGAGQTPGAASPMAGWMQQGAPQPSQPQQQPQRARGPQQPRPQPRPQQRPQEQPQEPASDDGAEGETLLDPVTVDEVVERLGEINEQDGPEAALEFMGAVMSRLPESIQRAAQDLGRQQGDVINMPAAGGGKR